jgi:hypothetical protein
MITLHYITQFFLFFLFRELGVYLTMLLLDQILYCRVIDGKWVGKFVRGGVCDLYGHTVCGLYGHTVCGLYGHTVCGLYGHTVWPVWTYCLWPVWAYRLRPIWAYRLRPVWAYRLWHVWAYCFGICPESKKSLSYSDGAPGL